MTRVFILLLGVCGFFMAGVSRAADLKAAGNRRTAVEIFADFNAAEAALPNYPLEARLDSKYKVQMKGLFNVRLRHLLDLIAELETVSPHDAARLRSHKCMFLVELSLYGDASSMKSLTDLSTSAVPADAVLGKVGLMAFKWWDSADAGTQKDIISQYEALAKANPADDVMVRAALTMARYLAASDEIGNSLRDIVEQDLKGPAAVNYQKQAVKIGRPFKIVVKTTNGPTVSTADWKGKVVLIDFWATWCPPCRAALPGLLKLYQEDHAKGLEVLGISNDSSLPQLKQFLAGNAGMVWPESFNPTAPNGWNAISPKMDVAQIPTAFLIDRDGILRDIEVGFIKEELLKKFLDEPVKPQAPAGAKAPAGAATQTAAGADAPPPANETAAPATLPAASSAASDGKANALLSLAKNYIAAKRTDLAQDKLNEILKKYPDTAAAKKARDLLAHLNPQ